MHARLQSFYFAVLGLLAIAASDAMGAAANQNAGAGTYACPVPNGQGSGTLLPGVDPGLVYWLTRFNVPTSLWIQCVAKSCNPNYTLSGNACYASSKACSIPNGSGTQQIRNGSYGSCVAQSCNPGFSLYLGACYASSQACTVANGTGSRPFQNGSYGACTVSSCNAGFSLYRGACYASSLSCTVANGIGSRPFQNGSYGACVAMSCNRGFSLYNGACYVSSLPCTVANGTGSRPFQNGSYASCTASSCNAGFSLYQGACYASTRACSVSNGFGTQSFQNGTYGSCVASSCNAGFQLTNGACQANTTPVTTRLVWTSQSLIPIPSSITSESSSLGGRISAVFSATNGETLTCSYSASPNSKIYSFAGCSAPAFTCPWNSCDSAIPFAAGDLVTADSFSLTVPGCPSSNPSCSLAKAQDVAGSSGSVCGSLVRSSLHLLGNLNCATDSRSATIELAGDTPSLDGRGHSIISPDAQYGLSLSGREITVKNIDVSGITNGIGVHAYNSFKLNISGTRANGNLIGIDVYVDSVINSLVTLMNNVVTNSSSMGIRISDEDTSHISPPQITGNNLSGSAQYGIFLRVSNATLQGSDKNKFDGSAYAIGLAGGSYRITNLDFSKSRIGKTALQAQGTRSLIISNCDFTISNSTDQNHFALNLYQVGSANISSLTVSGSDVGISVNTANGVSTNLVLSNSVIQNASLAGIWFRSDDATALGNIQVNNNDLRFNPSGRAVWLTGGVRMNPSPVFSNNQQ